MTFNNENGEPVSIRFRDNPQFYFQIVSPDTEENKSVTWVVRECPGQTFSEAEAFALASWDMAFQRLTPWLDRVIQDHVVRAASDEVIDRLRENLERTADELPNPEKPFTPEERDEWSKKLESIVERLGNLEAEHQIQQADMVKLKERLEQLSAVGATLPKRTWLKTAGHYVLDALATSSREGLKAQWHLLNGKRGEHLTVRL